MWEKINAQICEALFFVYFKFKQDVELIFGSLI